MHRSTRLPVLIALLVATVNTLASADPKDPKAEQAKVLFERARTLVKSGDFARACPLFEESQRIVPGLGTELNLAQCWAETGKLLAARELYAGVVERATKANQRARVDLANDGLAALAKRIPHLKIVVTGGTAKVSVDGKEVDPTAPVAVDPGSHRVIATAAPDRTAEQTVETTNNGATTIVSLDVRGAVDKPIKPPPPPPPVVEAPSKLRSRFTWALAGTSVAAVGTSIVLGTIARSRSKNLLDDCVVEGDVATCPRDQALRLRAARRYGTASTITFVGGLGLAASALALRLTAPSERRTQVRADVTSGSGQLVLEGEW